MCFEIGTWAKGECIDFSSGEWGRAEVAMYEECQELEEDKRNAASAARPDGG